MVVSCKDNPFLFGHDQALARWRQDVESGRLAHGWLICGPKGIGKATLAYHLARNLLAGNAALDLPPEHPVFKRVATGAHADFLAVSPAFDEKKGEDKTSILVEQAREIPKFLSLTPAEGQWRVVIVDSADALNANAANAILKALEEPPSQALLLLISHNPGGLLPTIRSRCQQIKLAPPSGEDFRRAVRCLYPEMELEHIAALEVLSGGSPGLAGQYEEQGALLLYEEILDVLSALPSLDPLAVHAFADRLASDKKHAQFRLFSELVLCLFARAAKAAAGIAVAPINDGEEGAMRSLAALYSPAALAAKWQQLQQEFSLAEARHLDYKQCVIVFFHSVANKDSLLSGAA